MNGRRITLRSEEAAGPAFEGRENYPYRVLPGGIHEMDEREAKRIFVTAFPASTRRATIFDGFSKLREKLKSMGVPATFWADGSFVEDKLDPGDVDVVCFCRMSDLEKLEGLERELFLQLVTNHHLTKDQYETHLFVVPVVDEEHPNAGNFASQADHWRKFFGTTREWKDSEGMERPGHPKGIVQIKTGDYAPPPYPERTAP